MAPADIERVQKLTASCEWTWIVGNHDPEPPKKLGGVAAETLKVGPLVLRHEPLPAPATGEIAGHLHPCGVVRVRGRRVRRRCFITDGTRVVLPAFGAYTGGLNVLDPAFAGLLPGRDFRAWMLSGDSVVPVSGRRLSPDAS